jgi:hypothetical protein
MDGSKVTEHLTHHLKVKGLSLGIPAGTVRVKVARR